MFGSPSHSQSGRVADDDIEHIRSRRRAHNRFGFALQLCVFRYPGRLLQPGEIIPSEIIEFLAAQLGIAPEDLADYAHRAETRREHLADLREIYGYKMFSGQGARDLKTWLVREAETARSNLDLARRLVEQCRQAQIILPGVSVVERLCADALVAAERKTDSRIAELLSEPMRAQLDSLLTELVDERISRFVWLRQFEVGKNSAGASSLLDRLEILQALGIPTETMDAVPPHRIALLRRQGERYFADGLRDISSDRRLAILAVCAVEWQAAIADAVVETHDRIVGKTWRDAKRLCDTRIDDAKGAVQQTLRSFTELGTALLAAHSDGVSLETAVSDTQGWSVLEELVATSAQLTNTMAADPLAHVVQGHRRFRRYAPRMLKALDIRAAPVAIPLLNAAESIGGKISRVKPTDFLRKNSKWHRHLKAQSGDDHRLWEVAVLFHLPVTVAVG